MRGPRRGAARACIPWRRDRLLIRSGGGWVALGAVHVLESEHGRMVELVTAAPDADVAHVLCVAVRHAQCSRASAKLYVLLPDAVRDSLASPLPSDERAAVLAAQRVPFPPVLVEWFALHNGQTTSKRALSVLSGYHPLIGLSEAGVRAVRCEALAHIVGLRDAQSTRPQALHGCHCQTAVRTQVTLCS